jgi:hypothetical protein
VIYRFDWGIEQNQAKKEVRLAGLGMEAEKVRMRGQQHRRIQNGEKSQMGLKNEDPARNESFALWPA